MDQVTNNSHLTTVLGSSNGSINCSTETSRKTNSLQGYGSIDPQTGLALRLSATPQIAFTINDFEPMEKIGSGKFGQVIKAKEKRSQRIVAIKKVKKELLNHYDFFQQMKKELEIQYRLSTHPNIAQLYAYFYDRDHIYSVLEYVPEGNLYQILRKVGCFNESTTRKIIQQVVSALFFCQQRNVIHRDIKPENILVVSSKTWYVKLCDFGWSTHSINQNRMTFCGTPDYLAPELVQSEPVPYDQKIDNWAVGILTYELLTGQSPFDPKTQAHYGNRNQNEIYRNIRNVDLQQCGNFENVSSEAKDFINKILKVDPSQRPSLLEIAQHPWIDQV